MEDLLWLRNINKEGMAMLGMKYDINVWRKTFVAIIQEIVEEWFRHKQQYVHMKSKKERNMQMAVWERE